MDGRFAFPLTGEVIDVKRRKILFRLRDEHSSLVQSEKMIEIDFNGSLPAVAGDQFGIGKIK